MTDEKKEASRERSRRWYADPKNREQQLKRQAAYYIENKEMINKRNKAQHRRREEEGKTIGGWVKNKYEGIPCLDCDQTYAFCAMDFDHRPEEDKSFGIGTKNRVPTTPESLAEIEKEIAKCDLVCANCHRVRTVSRYK